LQDADDLNVTLGAPVDEYALTYDHDTAKFVLRAPADLSGYALLAGRAGGQTIYGGTAANESITIHGTSNATRTTSYVLLQPSGGNVGIGTSAPGGPFTVAVGSSVGFTVSNAIGAPTVQGGLYTVVGPYAATVGGDNAAQFNVTNDKINGFALCRFGFTQGATEAAGEFGAAGTTTTLYPGSVFFNTKGAWPLVFAINGIERMRLRPDTGFLGIGTTVPGVPMHVVSTTAVTNAPRNVLALGSNVTSTGVGAAGLGAAVLFTAESTTTADTTLARVQALWYEATHATFKADLVGTAYDAGGEREGWRVRGNGSAPAIGFLGATPQARIAHVADPSGGATVDAEARAAINSILSTLELFGFHAAS
jgi:hypothetical protein